MLWKCEFDKDIDCSGHEAHEVCIVEHNNKAIRMCHEHARIFLAEHPDAYQDTDDVSEGAAVEEMVTAIAKGEIDMFEDEEV